MDLPATSRRRLLGSSGLLALGTLLPSPLLAQSEVDGLTRITDDVVPISAVERAGRMTRARALMGEAAIDAVLIEPGASLAYFTGIKWRRSERLTAAVLFQDGGILVVTPFFEEPSVRETLAVPAEVRVWQEDEDPIALVADAMRQRGVQRGRLGVEETVRFFVSQGLATRLPTLKVVSADPVVRRCRMIKSPAEIALMQKAADVTMAAYRWLWPRIRPGMTPGTIAALMNAATVRLGGVPQFSMALLGEASAYPHGSGQPQVVREGEAILMDCGCTVEDYQSDISRTFVLGKASAEVRAVWDTVREGQRIAFAAARLGAEAGSVDRAVRRFYESAGFGPGYRLPGLSHRTGHGIGLDGHEPVNLVGNETNRLAPGMCFSNEPGLYLPGKFGVRLEDCFHMTADGPRWLSQPAASLDQPV
ncbi:Xaa-Pro peptidase family protein [Novosphingobium sp.]|uniref:M24 family metallopeptidase n=1 Tax=Novosphingobium sp. TaxID=1874826 RepID=UPI00260E2546|nr:Xaa-Pro peptidase family protein [Novosphingobium sp.]